MAGTASTYQLPTASDVEGDVITLVTYEHSTGALPAFVSFDVATGIYSYNPTAADVGVTYTIDVEARDSMN